MSTPRPRRLIRPLVLLLALALSGCGGGGDDSASPPPASGGGSAPPVSDLALYQYYVSTDTAGYGCAVNSYWRDCDAFYNGLAYFDTYCARGHAQSCQYSQLLQGNYMSYRLARSPRG